MEVYRLNFESVTNMQNANQNPVFRAKTQNNQTEIGNFEEIVQKTQTKEVEEKISDMIDTVDKLKSMLEYDMSVDNLMEYKKGLKSFIEYYTKHELQVQDVLMTDRKGYTKKMQVIKTMNEKLNNMTTNMLETHLGHMQMLKDIGEIQGLITNLYL